LVAKALVNILFFGGGVAGVLQVCCSVTIWVPKNW